MQTKISNNIKIKNPSEEVVNWCNANLILDNPLYRQMMRLGRIDTIRFSHIPEKMSFVERHGDYISIPFGCIYAIYPMISKGEIITDFAPDMKNTICDLPIASSLSLRDYQEDAVKALVKAKGGILKAGCGAGKTITGIELVHRIGLRFLWLVHTHDLLNQARKDFLSLYPDMDIGLITEGKYECGKDGAIATVQTLSKMNPSIYANEFNIVIVDECHRAADKIDKVLMYKKVLGNMNPRYRYGLTATPYRQDGLTNTLYFNLGCNPKGTFEPTYAVERSRIKVLDAEVQSFELNTPMDVSFTVVSKVRKTMWFNADCFGSYDLSELKGKPICLKGIDIVGERKFSAITDKKKTKDGIIYDSSSNVIYGLSPEANYMIQYEGESYEDKMLYNSDGTIDFATLVNYLTHNQERTEAIADKAIELVKEGRKIAILSQSVDHCNALYYLLSAHGIKTRCVTGKTDKKSRNNALENTEEWDVIVATIQLFKEGIDIKTLDTVMIVTPMKDAAAIEQSCGRCERYMDGKTQPLFIYALDKNFPYCQGVFKVIKRVIKNRL